MLENTLYQTYIKSTKIITLFVVFIYTRISTSINTTVYVLLMFLMYYYVLLTYFYANFQFTFTNKLVLTIVLNWMTFAIANGP